MRLLSLSELYDMLEKHDWTYAFSDDHSVWVRGREADYKLRALLNELPDTHKALYEAYKDFVFDYDRKIPKPERPED